MTTVGSLTGALGKMASVCGLKRCRYERENENKEAASRLAGLLKMLKDERRTKDNDAAEERS